MYVEQWNRPTEGSPRGSLSYSFPRAAVTKYHKLGGLKQQKCILSQFWRPEILNQVAGKSTLPAKAPGKNPSLPSLPSGG